MTDEPTTSSPDAAPPDPPVEKPSASPERAPGVDPDESPFERMAIAGIPYEKGSEEDLAIRRVLEEAERERAHSAAARKA